VRTDASLRDGGLVRVGCLHDVMLAAVTVAVRLAGGPCAWPGGRSGPVWDTDDHDHTVRVMNLLMTRYQRQYNHVHSIMILMERPGSTGPGRSAPGRPTSVKQRLSLSPPPCQGGIDTAARHPARACGMCQRKAPRRKEGEARRRGAAVPEGCEKCLRGVPCLCAFVPGALGMRGGCAWHPGSRGRSGVA
jgi:hypothetical protein